MKQKTFFKINILFSVIILVGIYCLNYIYIKNINERTKRYMHFPKEKIKVASLGSSHSFYGINFYNDSKKINLGYPSQTLYYDYKILKKYSKNFTNKCIIIVPISIFSFYSNIDEDLEYISILDRNEFKTIGIGEWIVRRYFIVATSIGRMGKTIFSFFKNSSDYLKIEYPRTLDLEDKLREAEITSKRHLGISKDSKQNLLPQRLNELKKILKYSKEKGYNVILVTVPTSNLYNEKIGKENFKKRIYDNIEILKKDTREDIVYLDYSHDIRFEKKLDYFADDDHLNEEGAKKFTSILLNDLKSNGYQID